MKKRKYVWNQMYLRFVLNALAFQVKRPCVLDETQRCFYGLEKAFFMFYSLYVSWHKENVTRVSWM